jgi:hypothetical protein
MKLAPVKTRCCEEGDTPLSSSVEDEVAARRYGISAISASPAPPVARNDHLFRHEPTRRLLSTRDDLCYKQQPQYNFPPQLRMLDCVIFVTAPALKRMLNLLPGRTRSATLPELDLEHWDPAANGYARSPLTYAGMYKRPKTQHPQPCSWLSQPGKNDYALSSYRVLDKIEDGIVGSRCPDECVYVWRLNKSAFLGDLKSIGRDSISMRLRLRNNGAEIAWQVFDPYDLDYATMWDKHHDAITAMGGDVWWNLPLAHPFMRRWEAKSTVFCAKQAEREKWQSEMLRKLRRGEDEEDEEKQAPSALPVVPCGMLKMANAIWPLLWKMLDDDAQVRLRYTNKELDLRLRFLCPSQRWETIPVELTPMALRVVWTKAEEKARDERILSMSQQPGPGAVRTVWIALSLPMVLARCDLQDSYSGGFALKCPSKIPLALLLPKPKFPMDRVDLQYVGSKNLLIARCESDAKLHKKFEYHGKFPRDPVPRFAAPLPLEPAGTVRYLFWKCTLTQDDYVELLYKSLSLHLVFDANNGYSSHSEMHVLPIEWSTMRVDHLRLPWLTRVSGVTTNLMNPPSSLDMPLVFHTMVAHAPSQQG